MNYQVFNAVEYNIHIIKNKKFHTTECRIYFTENVSKELITYRNVLVGVLTYATKNYDTKEKLIKKCQDLYSLAPVAGSIRNGNILTTKFSLSTINSSYIKENNLIDNILLLKEIILNPLVNDKAFFKKYFDIIKKELEIETKTIEEDPRLYANINLLKLISKDEKILSGYSDLKILKEMTPEKLYQSYLEMLNNSKIDIYISGNIKNTNEIVKVIKENFIFKYNHHHLNKPLIIHDNKNDKPKVCEEVRKLQQSKLSMGYKYYNLTNYESRYVSVVFNNILGGGVNSILMRSIREESSLCYYINSFSNRMDNLLIINSGIDKENYQEVLKMIQDGLNNIIEGNFTLKEVEEAKMELLYSLSNIFESNRSIMDYYYGRDIFNSDDVDTKIKMIKNVSKEDVMNLAKKINLDGVFFLKGDL